MLLEYVAMTPEELSAAIAQELDKTIASGQLTLADNAELPLARVERPKSREHGDWATNIALRAFGRLLYSRALEPPPLSL